jgi:hypothetical protein
MGCGWSAPVPEAMPAPHCDRKYCRMGMPYRMCACSCARCHKATCANGCEKCTFAPQPKYPEGFIRDLEDATKLVCILTFDPDEPGVSRDGAAHVRVDLNADVEELAREWRWARQGMPYEELEKSPSFEDWLVSEGYARRTDVEVIDP